MWTRKYLRMSWWNAVLGIVLLVATVVLAINGQVVQSIIMGALTVFLIGSAVYARSGRSSDVTRLNALESVDERDRAMASFALAVVGVAAMFVSVAVLIAGIFLLEPGEPMFWVVIGQMFVLAITWTIANIVAARRG